MKRSVMALMFLSSLVQGAESDGFEVLRCKPGLPPSNGLFSAVAAKSLQHDYDNLNLYFNLENDNILTCGSYKEGSRYGVGYFGLSSKTNEIPPEMLKPLAPLLLVKSRKIGNYDGNTINSPMNFWFKSFSSDENFQMLGLEVPGSGEYTIYSCFKEHTPFTNKICKYTDGLD